MSTSGAQQYIEVPPEDLAAHHLGQPAYVRYPNDLRYDIGTITAIAADNVAINVLLAGIERPIIFTRPDKRGRVGENQPRLFILG